MAQGSNAPRPQRRWLKSLLVLVVLISLGAGGFLVYQKYEPDRLARRARGYVHNGDYRNAVLSLGRALAINPASLSASQLMAEITAQLQVPDAIDWRRRFAELNPGSASEAFAWTDAALRLQNPATPKQALASMPEPERSSAAYRSKAGTLALTAGKWREAEEHYAEALKREPSNELHQYNYATLQLQSRQRSERKDGAETLERLASSGRVEEFARRFLVAKLSRERRWDEALRHSVDLIKASSAQFGDRLVHLQLLKELKRPEFSDLLADGQEAASEDVESASLMLNWMRLEGLADNAIKWANGLPRTTAASPRVAAGLAECLIEMRDWTQLRKLTEDAEWREEEELRLAYFARSLREQGDAAGSKARWTASVSLAARDRESASRLAYLAASWGWREEAREMLWAAVDAPGPQWALQMLHRLCHVEGDTNGLLRVASRLVELEPNNDRARNNVAMLSLLLGRDTENALATARALHAKDPRNPMFASTYAFALHLHGRSDEGLAIMKKLTPDELLAPQSAAYYGMLLATTGSKREARSYFEISKKALLLPEERALIATSRD